MVHHQLAAAEAREGARGGMVLWAFLWFLCGFTFIMNAGEGPGWGDARSTREVIQQVLPLASPSSHCSFGFLFKQ